MSREIHHSTDFFDLSPERVLDAVEAGGFHCTGLCYPLNSMENRVYELELEDGERVIAKFYRPGRWSGDAIRDEHDFLYDCREAEIPVVAPLILPNRDSVAEAARLGIWYALFPKVGGRSPDELADGQLHRLGVLLARIHNVGATADAPYRLRLTADEYARGPLETLLEHGVGLTPDLHPALIDAVETIADIAEEALADLPVHRIHGDCHLGNLIWRPEGPAFVDFDDMLVGPAVQDIWLLAPSGDAEGERQRRVVVEGYRTMREFDLRWLSAVEPLRALRVIHYAAWITRRWADPSFPRAFPHYGTADYWRREVHDLAQMARAMAGDAAFGGLAGYAAAASDEGTDEGEGDPGEHEARWTIENGRLTGTARPPRWPDFVARDPGLRSAVIHHVRAVGRAGDLLAETWLFVEGGNGEPAYATPPEVYEGRFRAALEAALTDATEALAESSGAGSIIWAD